MKIRIFIKIDLFFITIIFKGIFESLILKKCFTINYTNNLYFFLKNTLIFFTKIGYYFLILHLK